MNTISMYTKISRAAKVYSHLSVVSAVLFAYSYLILILRLPDPRYGEKRSFSKYLIHTS